MTTENTRLLELLRCWSDRSITIAEEHELAGLLGNHKFEESLQVHVQELVDQYRSTEILPAIDWEETYNNIQGRKLYPDLFTGEQGAGEHPGGRRRVLYMRPVWWAAAVLLLVVTGLVIFLQEKDTKSESKDAVVTIPDLLPGQEGAILTLANGKQIVLDDLKNGVVAEEQGAQIHLAEGKLVYQPGNTGAGTVQYNKMSTPKGRQFQLTLPDGTRAWLNAESSIEYPTAFTGNFRNIKVTGEVYFDIAAKASQPFSVQIGADASIDVLGTSFNINAYENEDRIEATLINGAIRFTPAAKAGYILKPGEQVQLSAAPAQQITINKGVDISRVVAWKNGVFSFEGLMLKDILRQLERWYDFKVVYKNQPSTMLYRGGMDRNVKFSEILEVLKEMRVNYDWDGKILTIK